MLLYASKPLAQVLGSWRTELAFFIFASRDVRGGIIRHQVKEV